MKLESVLTARTTLVRRYVGFRCLHAFEGGFLNPVGMPNVRPAIDAPPVTFTAGLQILSWELMRFKNPLITKAKWRAVFDDTRAFTNEQGYGNEDDPRADFVNGLDLTKDPPKLMKALICAGMFIRGTIEGNYLVCRPGVHAIDANKPLPTVQEVIDNDWCFVATTGTGREGAFHFPQGDGSAVYIPYVLKETVYYPLEGVDKGRPYRNFVAWDETFLPDPLRYYLPTQQ